MNWRTGLFRIWVVFALVWIAGGVYLTDHGYWRTQILNAQIEASVKKAKLDPHQNPFEAAAKELKRLQIGSVAAKSSTPDIPELSKEFGES